MAAQYAFSFVTPERPSDWSSMTAYSCCNARTNHLLSTPTTTTNSGNASCKWTACSTWTTKRWRASVQIVDIQHHPLDGEVAVRHSRRFGKSIAETSQVALDETEQAHLAAIVLAAISLLDELIYGGRGRLLGMVDLGLCSFHREGPLLDGAFQSGDLLLSPALCVAENLGRRSACVAREQPTSDVITTHHHHQSCWRSDAMAPP